MELAIVIVVVLVAGAMIPGNPNILSSAKMRSRVSGMLSTDLGAQASCEAMA